MIYWLKIAALLIASLAMSYLVTQDLVSAVIVVVGHIVTIGPLVYLVIKHRERKAQT